MTQVDVQMGHLQAEYSRADRAKTAVRFGLLAGIIALSVSVIGMVEAFDLRDIITDYFTLGQLLLFAAPTIVGYVVVSQYGRESKGTSLLGGGLAGFLSAVPLVGLLLLAAVWPTIRDSFVNVSPSLIEILTFGKVSSFPLVMAESSASSSFFASFFASLGAFISAFISEGYLVGSLMLLFAMMVLGIIGAVAYLVPTKYTRPFLFAFFITLGFGMFSDVLLNILRPMLPRSLLRLLFGIKGITLVTTIVVFVLSVVGILWWDARGKESFQKRKAAQTAVQRSKAQKVSMVVASLFLLVLPLILGTYLTEVVDNVGIYILMGFGLNIVVGFAGLLDLGYVAFFAIGAYTMGILTSAGGLGGAHLNFWVALPIAIGAAVIAGLILGIPVLGMRGDYLAIVTLGFGEIIRVLVVSDLLKEYIGGAQGILQIPKPEIFGMALIQPQQSYYLILAGAALAGYVSWRMRDSRAGRRWMAMREDEDVAEAMGIHLISTKLLAFGMGAAFSGLAGAIFASRLGSVFPHSFNLLISINVLSLIIVGGIGSLPGVVVGALVLVGLPELLREFAEYRMLLYGALLITMMLLRPEGLWPSPISKRELHAADEEAVTPE